MTAALLTGMAVWLVVVPPPTRRVRAFRSQGPPRAPLDVGLVAGAMAPLIGWILIGWPWGLVVGLVAAPLVRDAVKRLESSADRRRAEQIGRQLPGSLDLIAAALAAGRPPSGALRVVSESVAEPLAAELGAMADRLVLSSDSRSALAEAPPGLTVLARALRRADESGAPVATVVAHAADDVRREAKAKRQESARRVGVRTALPLGACFLPAFLLIGIVPTVVSLFGTLDF